MRVHFWGTRGSLPASLTQEAVRSKLVTALLLARGKALETDEQVSAFVDGLPAAVRGTWGCNTSCVEIRGGDAAVLCDAGTGLRDYGVHVLSSGRRGEAPPRRFHLFLSHPHWDHIQGFPFFTPAYVPGNEIVVHGGHAALETAFVAQQDPLHFPVPLSAMRARIVFDVLEPEREYEIAGLRVRAIRQNHPGDSYGYRFERDGRVVVYSTDAEHKEDAEREDYPFVEFFREADVLIVDAQYSLRDAIDVKENWGHSSNLVAVELAVRSRARRLFLFHQEHTWGDEALERFLDDTRKYLRLYAPDSPLVIDLARDGLDADVA